MAEIDQSNFSEQKPVNRFHLAVGFLVLTVGIYVSAFAVQMLFLR
jgi:hypothetical protein